MGEGAHDDGAGCMQAIEVLRLYKALGWKPKRTIRAVMWMNEENGLVFNYHNVFSTKPIAVKVS